MEPLLEQAPNGTRHIDLRHAAAEFARGPLGWTSRGGSSPRQQASVAGIARRRNRRGWPPQHMLRGRGASRGPTWHFSMLRGVLDMTGAVGASTWG